MHKLSEVLTLLVSHNIPFFIYQLPQEDTFVLGIQKEKQLQEWHADSFSNRDGFLFAPFSIDRNAAYFICADSSFRLKKNKHDTALLPEKLLEIACGIIFDALPAVSDDYVATKSDYIEVCNQYIANIRNGKPEKAILSRIVVSDKSSRKDAGELFLSLASSYPSAFVFLVNLPGVTCWAGASPETLLHVDENGFRTMSLAGTQRWEERKSDDPANWTKKDKEEQAFVTRYIESLLQKFIQEEKAFHPEIELHKSELKVKRAGNVGHLLTEFSCRLPLSSQQLQRLVNMLHPTPAVCGTPKEEALALILEKEKHQRAYYAGYLGPVSKEGRCDLFVNLRCARLCEDHLSIFVGGGITADSEPEKEWEETCLKAETILNVINKKSS
ncbi:MAG: isochorismate synthase [Bacteroidales bacterium]